MSVELIELGLSHTHKSADARESLAAVVEQLLALILEMPVESGRLKTSEFGSQLQSFHARILVAPNAGAAAEMLHQCLDACQDYLQRARGYMTERENELGEVIKVLRAAVAELTGEAGQFHNNLLSTTERFHQLTKIDDLRQLRSAIAQEVGGLKKMLAEKQKKDEASFTRLSKRIDGLRSKLKEVQEEAALDALTRVANRGSFDAALARWVAEHESGGAPFVLALLDIDDFKRINDTLGHPVGDRVLVCAAQWLASNVRGDDFVARYGGEEFAVLLSGVKLKQAELKFAALLEKIAASSYQYSQDSEQSVMRFTFSCGLAEYNTADTAESLIGRADQALYQAKRGGKNQVRSKSRHLLRNLF